MKNLILFLLTIIISIASVYSFCAFLLFEFPVNFDTLQYEGRAIYILVSVFITGMSLSVVNEVINNQ